MKETRIKISSIVENQLPQFVSEEFPLVSEFLSQYYISLESQGNVSDILQNIDQYIKVDQLTNLIDSTTLTSDVTFFDSTINVTSTAGFPDSYGLLLIDSEIITYTSKTSTTFDGCIRGFSGVTSYAVKDELTFSESQAEEHFIEVGGNLTTVTNLSILFLKEFFKKVKKQITPGFEDRELYSNLNERLFVKQSIDFYSSKGTDNSFKILFGALYGENVEVIRPRDYLIKPSDAQYRITSDLVAEKIEGNPESLVNNTLYQEDSEGNVTSQGTITQVEKIRRGSKDYYIISLDSGYDRDILSIGSIYGKFKIHPKTRVVSRIPSESTTLEVDSTVSFPTSNGTLVVDLENGTSLNITYGSKTLNQFLDCQGISQDIPESTEIKTNEFAYGYADSGNTSIVKVRITGVLSELNLPDNSAFYSEGDTIRIKSLGLNTKDSKFNNWFFNVPVKYEVSEISIVDKSDEPSKGKLYNITLSDDHSFRVGDLVTFVSSSGDEQTANVISFNNEKSFTVQFGSNQSELNSDLTYTVKRNVSKVSAERVITKLRKESYPSVNNYTSNVQNVYSDDSGSLYVSSPSLPTYLDQTLLINDRSVVFSGSFSGTTLNIGDHGFYTGDSIVYKPTIDNTLGISGGIYFIKKVSGTEVKLARSRNNIFTENFVSVNGSVTDAKFELTDFTYADLSTQLLESQKLIRKISNPEIGETVYETNPGLTGIFINGVELLNYKTKDNVYYGPIQSIVPSAPGSGYDIINPPILSITDPVGSGASGHCSVIGKLEKINVIDSGFDYIDEPVIEITGGNGSGAIAKANLVTLEHSVEFNSQSSANLVQLSPTNKVGFSSYHKFRNAEEVIYVTDGQNSVGGLSTNSTYFVSTQDLHNIKLHKSYLDAVVGINTIQLTSYGTGNHFIKSKNLKRKIGSITVVNSGSNYQNKLTITDTSGISTASNSILIPNHGYESGEIIVYDPTETPIGGLTSSTSYYVTKINEDEFKLSKIGIGNSVSLYFSTNQYVNLTSTGSGNHRFNYPEIKVSVKGRIGVSTFSVQDFNAIIQPIFRGEVQSVFVSSKGTKYGSEEIINHNRQPLFELNSGSGAELTPIISNGRIAKVLVKNSGSGYNSPPDLQIDGVGIGALLTPIISNGHLIEVKVINGGIGYKKENTFITVNSSGTGAKFEAQIKSWKVNLVERLILDSKVNDDDGILVEGLNSNYGLQYAHAYAPRNLRRSVQSITFKDGKKIFVPDLQIFSNKELTSESHSPIIGWAYDGNPIYGPYGFASEKGGSAKLLTSSYELQLKENRPSTSIYPQGFFVEDYSYNANGDLDEHNGRFGITPEYPNGVYAYFTTIGSGEVEESGVFANYKKPTFPYAIGPTYKSKPINFNFESLSNQDNIDINQTNWKRNIGPYNPPLYDYLFNPNKIKNQNSVIKNISKGYLKSLTNVSGGQNYKVGDQITLNNELLYKFQESRAKVSSIKGKLVNQISVATSSFENVQLYPDRQQFIGFTTVPHNYLNNDLVVFTGKNDYKKFTNINVRENNLILSSGIGSVQHTGLVTYFNVTGNLQYPNIKENDIYQINDEQIKILNVDEESSRVRVIRNQNATTGITSYKIGTPVSEKSKKFGLNFGISTTYNFAIDREFYFDPTESIGIGTTSGVGIVSTIYFSNPGAGVTQLTIPTQSVYIKNHNIKTGDLLIYSSNGGNQISVSTDGVSTFQLTNNSVVYAAKITNDLIGISTVQVGLGSTGTFVAIGSSTLQNSILYFTSVGTGNTHSFKTNYSNTLIGKVSKNVVTVSTAETHGLSLFDNVTINVKSGISTTVTVRYNDYNRRLVLNPKTFASIDTDNNIITINNHGFYDGQKVIYTSPSPATGLTDQEIYYVVVIDSNRIKLANSFYQATKSNPEVIDINSSSSGSILPINPPLNLTKNQTVVFDLSDSSLSYKNNSISYPAFDLKFYKDKKFNEEFDISIFQVTESGKVGIDSEAKIALNLKDYVPTEFYYTLIPIDLNLNSQIKKDIIQDDEVIGSNKITLSQSGYDGNYSIVAISSNTFSYNVLSIPESTSYSNDVEYYTNSLSAKGPIQETLVLKSGEYKSLPNIISILSDEGSGGVLDPSSTSIGKVKEVEIEDIGFEYSSDYSVRPIAKFPSFLVLEPLSSFDYIGISSNGRNYNTAPSLVVIDGLTNRVINDIDLFYKLGDSTVTIKRNNKTISSNPKPKIIPTNNSNGVKIKNIVFNSTSKDVIVTLGASFSDPEDYPFAVGSKVLIENTSVGIATTGKGYNSSNYDYALFTLTAVDPNIGGTIGTVTYNLSSYLKDGEVPGTFSSIYSAGKIIPESHFPIFDPVLKKNNFYKGETVYSPTSTGKVESWDETNQYLKVSTIDDFAVGESILGETTNSVGIIKEILSFETDYKVDATSLVKKGWHTETGFLNNDLQRIHDSDYYQYFSYALRSKKDLSTWDNPVSALNHTAGFKKFGSLIIDSLQENVGISTNQNQGDFIGIADLSRVIDLNCVYDFDLASENNLLIDGNIKSNEILFNSRIIQDYIESIGNKVLMIDDISGQFNSNPRATNFGIVDSFTLDDVRSKKYITLVKDRRSSSEVQVSLVSLIHNDTNGFLNQYGMNSLNDLGFFDFNITGNKGNLLFYPIKFRFNDYYISNLSFSLNDVVSGVGTTNLGTSVRVNTDTTTISTGSNRETIASIASTYRSSKVLVQIGATNSSYYEYDELTYIHNDSEVLLLDYGQITTDTFVQRSTSGIGTYDAYISGNNVVIDLIPYDTTSVDYVVNTFNVSLANTSLSGVGTQIIGGATLDSSSVSISSSPSPTANTIASYSNVKNNCSYSIISIEDETNSQYQVSEFLTITDTFNNQCYIVEFGNLNTSSSLGIITAGISGSITNTYFTPIANIDVDVKVFQTQLYLIDESIQLSLNNGSLSYDYETYIGTDNDIKKSFDLKYQNIPIFQRYFDGSNSSIVNITKNTIQIPYHNFVTGEEINYSYSGAGSGPIGIAETTITGIGTTDKLPSTLYAVKVDNLNIQLADTASNALKSIPTILNISAVGIGSSHIFTSKNQNKKSLISIDNIIQSPITSTAVTTTLSKNVGFFDSEISISGINSISGGDLLKIDNEIMRVASVGVGSTNSVSVIRPWLGTGLSTHSSSSLVKKVLGNYNIVDNTIYFDEAPYGKVPILNSTNRADEIDYTGIVTGSTFSGRIFLRSGEQDTSIEPYNKNYIFDDISSNFNGIGKTFTLKSEGSNVTGISTDNAIVLINDIFQGPSTINIVDSYDLTESAGITTITFVGTSASTIYDVNTANIPRGGIILSVGSTEGFGYQPLVAAGGTAIVSVAGTIQSISIGNSGSGYRVGVQTVVNVGVKTESTGIPNIEFIGTASVSNGRIVGVSITNPGIGYTSSNPPIVIFDSPLSYSNIPLIYSSQSPSGVGTGAFVDVVVGQGSSVISFELKNLGYGYKPNDILTVSIGGTAGIPTDTSLSFSKFEITVDKVQSDKFASWSVGRLQVIDPLDTLFDGNRKSFPILINGNQTTIRSKKLTKEEVQATLLVFINDVLQVPGKGYTFNGGSIIRFTEAPKEGDTSRILFYRGTGDLDTQDVDILETIKIGDDVLLTDDSINLTQEDRVVTDIVSSDIINTNLYSGPGVSSNENLIRPLTWCRQTEDRTVNGFYVGKDRSIYEPYIQPTTNIIQNIGIASTAIFVESVKAFFDSEKEYVHDGTNEKPQNKILIVSQDTITSAISTAIVSTSGTISSIAITNGGVGYSSAPLVTIAGPIGFGTTTSQNTARALATISGGVVTGIAITVAGLGYSITEPPAVLIDPPSFKYEIIDKVSYEGDFGVITGIKTTSVGVASTGIVFDFFIPSNSILRDGKTVKVGIATTGISGIQTGYYFVVSTSNVGKGLTSLNSSGNIVGVGTTFIDNIYQVAAVSIAQTAVPGVGITNVAKVTVSVSDYNGLSGLGFSSFYGEYSWGRILTPIRKNPEEFITYANVGGISTSPIVQRYNKLKYVGYSTS
jgi:hypothetical protein